MQSTECTLGARSFFKMRFEQVNRVAEFLVRLTDLSFYLEVQVQRVVSRMTVLRVITSCRYISRPPRCGACPLAMSAPRDPCLLLACIPQRSALSARAPLARTHSRYSMLLMPL